MTIPTQLVLRALLEHPSRELYGLEICGAAGLQTGTIHPILARLERLGWVQSRWEDVDPSLEGRPRRRYYRLTRDGAELARESMAKARTPIGMLPGLRPNPASGG